MYFFFLPILAPRDIVGLEDVFLFYFVFGFCNKLLQNEIILTSWTWRQPSCSYDKHRSSFCNRKIIGCDSSSDIDVYQNKNNTHYFLQYEFGADEEIKKKNKKKEKRKKEKEK